MSNGYGLDAWGEFDWGNIVGVPLEIEPEYIKPTVNAMLHALFSYLVKYGWNDSVVSMYVSRINQFTGRIILTGSDIQRAMGYIKDSIYEKWDSQGYYGTDVPRTIKLIWRDKIFYAKAKAISKLIGEVL